MALKIRRKKTGLPGSRKVKKTVEGIAVSPGKKAKLSGRVEKASLGAMPPALAIAATAPKPTQLLVVYGLMAAGFTTALLGQRIRSHSVKKLVKACFGRPLIAKKVAKAYSEVGAKEAAALIRRLGKTKARGITAKDRDAFRNKIIRRELKQFTNIFRGRKGLLASKAIEKRLAFEEAKKALKAER